MFNPSIVPPASTEAFEAACDLFNRAYGVGFLELIPFGEGETWAGNAAAFDLGHEAVADAKYLDLWDCFFFVEDVVDMASYWADPSYPWYKGKVM